MVPADSRRITRVPRYSGYHWALTSLHIRGSHPLWPDFPERSVRDPSAVAWSYYPDAALPQRRFGLFPGRSPLLGESLLFSLPRGTKMFQFPRLPPTRWVAGPRLLGSPIRAPRDRSPCAAPPGLSRLAAPFVGSLRQGIRRAPSIPSGRLAPPASDHVSFSREISSSSRYAALRVPSGDSGEPRGPDAAGVRGV